MARPVDLEADGSVIWESEGRTIDPDLVPGERYTESRPPTADSLDVNWARPPDAEATPSAIPVPSSQTLSDKDCRPYTG